MAEDEAHQQKMSIMQDELESKKSMMAMLDQANGALGFGDVEVDEDA